MGTTSIRLTEQTVARMREEIQRIKDAVERNQREDPGIAAESINPKSLGFTYDQLINLLLDARERDRRRERKFRAKKKGQGQAEQAEG
jgi:hypothetical protein